MQQDKLKEAFSKIKQDILNLQSQISDIKRTLDNQTQLIKNQTHHTDIQTDNTLLKPSNHQIPTISIGNGGVPTDRQTNQQTDRQIQKFAQDTLQTPPKDHIEKLKKVSDILESLGEIKKELRSKFKKLTQQEMLIFSTIYQLEEQKETVDYSKIATKLNLSESSIRDYILKISKKEIPIIKTKIDNKKVILSISEDIKKLATLETIIQLREL